MKVSDEQIKEILELKEAISKKIRKHTEEIELLEKNLSVLNLFIKDSSFTKASSLKIESKNDEKDSSFTKDPSSKIESKSDEKDSIPITKGVDGEIIANAYVTPEKVSIVLKNELGFDFDTPPFRTFFMDRIIGEMKKKDTKEVEDGNIQQDSIIDCIINKDGNSIREIIIKNYRQRERVDEIINTASWSLTKMLENMNK